MSINRRLRSLTALLSLAALPLAAPRAVLGEDVPARMDATLETVTATVAMIHKETRTVALQFSDDSIEQFVVGPEVKRFDEIAVGDTVAVEYLTAMGIELRAPTAAEKAEPFVVLNDAVRGGPEGAPTGGLARTIRVVATVEVLDRIHNSATLMGPKGNQVTVRVKQPEMLTKARIGDTVVVTYTEAVAVSLEKVTKAPSAPAGVSAKPN